METCPRKLEKFVDIDNLLQNVVEVRKITGEDVKKAETIVETFARAVDKYQEQPELLDPYLDDLIQQLTCDLSYSEDSKTRYHTIFKLLYQLVKVRGFKSIGKKFPHDTHKLPILVELLARESPNDKLNWHTRFVLTVWLSILILTPFDLAKFDSDSSDRKVVDRLYSILTKALESHDSSQHVTAYCLARLFSRQDVLKSSEHLTKFISESLEELSQVKIGAAGSTDDIKLIGHLRTLAYVFKFLPRQELKARNSDILASLLKTDLQKVNRELVGHLVIKLLQRAGLALLPVRVATWRYKRGTRILGQLNVSGNDNDVDGQADLETTKGFNLKLTKDNEDNDNLPISNEEEAEAADYIESVLSTLFVAAQNPQTKIRWSAAKGIARLASRLSRERASDVINMLLCNFFDADSSSEFAWHGGCLTLAEMSRNGLLVEEKLPEVIRVISEAIIYDKIKGSFAVGSHVREAACYVCWAMARTYEDHLLKDHLATISVNLLCTMLFDRELQCRRAASATFQELVGRQGAFDERAIDILNCVDYQNVGQRQFCYLHLALKISSYDTIYAKAFVEHLLDKKVGHWDVQIRRLTSESLAAMMLYLGHDYVQDEILPKLTGMCQQNSDNNLKHGALLSLAHTIKSLVPLEFKFDRKLVDFVSQVVELCDKQLKSKQQAPNFLEAIGLMITSSEVAKFTFDQRDEDDQGCNQIQSPLKQWESIAFTALSNANVTMREIGAQALLTIYRMYYKHDKTNQDRLLTTLNKSIAEPNENTRCGALRALAKLSQVPPEEIKGVLIHADTPDIVMMSIITFISKDTHEQESGCIYAQAKAEACESLVNFVYHLEPTRLVVSSELLKAAYDALIAKTEDYTFDKQKGDIGVVVRRAAVKALLDLSLHLHSVGVKAILQDSHRISKIISKILQQSVSYHNTAREQAALAFYRLMSSSIGENGIPHRDFIMDLFEKFQIFELQDEFNWRDDSTPLFVSLLGKQEYSVDLWTGLIPAVGQVSDFCAKQFRDALSDYLGSPLPVEERTRVFDAFIAAMRRTDLNHKSLLTSGLAAADYLLTSGLMSETTETFQLELMEFCWEHKTSQDPKRLILIARVLACMLQFSSSIQVKCLEYCFELLLCGYQRVRVYMAEQLYQSVLTYQSELEQIASRDIEELLELLSSTNWSEPLAKLNPIRDQLGACFLHSPQ